MTKRMLVWAGVLGLSALTLALWKGWWSKV